MHESSSSSSSTLSPVPDGFDILEGSESQSKPRAQRTLAPNLTRRSHKKSRGGCYNCKNRKIKCQETRPGCENCQIKELECVYPTKADRQVKKREDSSGSSAVVSVSPSVPQAISATSDTFTLADMRFLHHFIISAHPHLPLGNEDVWVRQVPLFAQEHSYLLSALLALGASHLTRVAPGVDYHTQAITHRGHAIEGLNRALTRTDRSHGEADAMLAACYALTFQSSYMADGLLDFLTMIRGCALVTWKVQEEGEPTAFNVESDVHLRIMNPRLDHLPVVDRAISTAAVNALTEVQTIIRTPMAHSFHRALLNCVMALQQSSRAGYLNFIQLYHVFYELNHEEFAAFVDPDNVVIQMLLAYFIAIQAVMAPLAQYEWPERADQVRPEILLGIVDWLEKIIEKMPEHVQPYLRWPAVIARCVRAEITGQSPDTPKVLRLESRYTTWDHHSPS